MRDTLHSPTQGTRKRPFPEAVNAKANVTVEKLLPLLAGLLLLLCLPSVAPSQEVKIPSPLGYVNDYASVIDPDTRTQLTKLLKEVEQKTTAEIAILTVETTRPLEVFQYSIKVFDRWKIGKKGKDNGVLFLVAVKDRRMWITVGYGLEGILPDGKVGEIRDRIVIPYFRQGNYSKGIFEGTQAIARVLAGEEVGPAPKEQPRVAPPHVSPLSPSIFAISPWTGVWVPLLLSVLFLCVLGMFVLASFHQDRRKTSFRSGGFWIGGAGGWGGGGFGGGNFGGFGGGSSGGGGAGGGW